MPGAEPGGCLCRPSTRGGLAQAGAVSSPVCWNMAGKDQDMTDRSVVGKRMIVGLVLVALLSVPATAQEKPKPPAGQAAAPKAGKARAPEEGTQRLEVKWSGGTVEDYIEAIRKAAPGANVIVAPSAAKLLVPAVDLRNIDIETAVMGVLDGRRSADGAKILVVGTLAPGVYRVEAADVGDTPSTEARSLVVLSLRDLVGDRSGQADEQVKKQLRTKVDKVDFQDISLADVLEFLRQLSKANLTVDWAALSAAGVDRTTEVSLKLADVTVEAALKTILAHLDANLIYEIVGNQVHITTGDRRLSRGMSFATVSTALETALEMVSQGAPPPKLKFHEDTKLLFVHGTQDQLQAVQQVVEQLRQSAELTSGLRLPAPRLSALEQRAARLETMLKLLARQRQQQRPRKQPASRPSK